MRMRQGIVGVGRGAASLVFREPNTNHLPNPEAFNLWTLGQCTVAANHDRSDVVRNQIRHDECGC